jgi:DNA recombination protein Rad52
MGHLRRRVRPTRRMTTRRKTPDRASDGLPREVADLLAQPLDLAFVSERELRDGRLIQYIEGWAVINQANRIFGHDGWGAEVVGDVAYRPLSLVDSVTDTPAAIGMYTATVRVTARGCPPKADVGCGFVAEETPEAHEAAYKGAVTDALKRALRHFGDQFGNGLYDRRNVADTATPRVAPPASPARLEAMRGKVLDLSMRLGVDEAKARASVQKRYGLPLDEMGEEQLAAAIRALADLLNRRNGQLRAA